MQVTLGLIGSLVIVGRALAMPVAPTSDISIFNETLKAMNETTNTALSDEGDLSRFLDDYDEDEDEDDDDSQFGGFDDDSQFGDFDDDGFSHNNSTLEGSSHEARSLERRNGAVVDCDEEAGSTCSTMCFAALCRSGPTGVQLDGGAKTAPLQRGLTRKQKAASSSHASTSTKVTKSNEDDVVTEVIAFKNVRESKKQQREPFIQDVDHRVLAGTSSRPTTLKKMKAAGLIVTGENGHGLKYAKKGVETLDRMSPDEWPPASSQEGGLQSVVHMVPLYAQTKQSHAVSAMWSNGGMMVVKNWKKNQVCVAFNAGTHSECKSNQAFGSLDYKYPGAQNTKFYQAGSLPDDAPSIASAAQNVKDFRAGTYKFPEGEEHRANRPAKKPKTPKTKKGKKRPTASTHQTGPVPQTPKTGSGGSGGSGGKAGSSGSSDSTGSSGKAGKAGKGSGHST